MLVLRRKLKESIHIGDEVVVTVLATNLGENGWVKLGVEAPRGIAVHRHEVIAKMRTQEAAEQDGKAEMD